MGEIQFEKVKIQSKEIGTQIDWGLYFFDRKESKPVCCELNKKTGPVWFPLQC
jgi:hypothetical protein